MEVLLLLFLFISSVRSSCTNLSVERRLCSFQKMSSSAPVPSPAEQQPDPSFVSPDDSSPGCDGTSDLSWCLCQQPSSAHKQAAASDDDDDDAAFLLVNLPPRADMQSRLAAMAAASASQGALQLRDVVCPLIGGGADEAVRLCLCKPAADVAAAPPAEASGAAATLAEASRGAGPSAEASGAAGTSAEVSGAAGTLAEASGAVAGAVPAAAAAPSARVVKRVPAAQVRVTRVRSGMTTLAYLLPILGFVACVLAFVTLVVWKNLLCCCCCFRRRSHSFAYLDGEA